MEKSSGNKTHQYGDGYFSQTVMTLMKESGFDQETSEMIIGVFCKQATMQLEEVNKLLDCKSFDEIVKILHTFKGGAGTARVKEMAQYALEAEEAAKNEDKELLEKLLDTLDNLLKALKNGKKAEK